MDCGYDSQSLALSGEPIISFAITGQPIPFTGKMTQLVASTLNVPTIKTISLACASIQGSLDISPERVVLVATTHRVHTAAILGCFLAFQGTAKSSFDGFKMIYDFWNVKQLSTLKPDSTRLVGLAIVPSIIRTLIQFDELLALKRVTLNGGPSPKEEVGPDPSVERKTLGEEIAEGHSVTNVSSKVAPLVLRAIQLKSIPKAVLEVDKEAISQVVTLSIEIYSLSSDKGVTDLIWTNSIKRTLTAASPTLFLPHIKVHGELLFIVRQVVTPEKSKELFNIRLHTGTLQPQDFPNILEPRTTICLNRKDFDATTNNREYTDEFSLAMLFGKHPSGGDTPRDEGKRRESWSRSVPLPARNSVTITPQVKCSFLRCNGMFFPPPAVSLTACPFCRTVNTITDLALPYYLTSAPTVVPELSLPISVSNKIAEPKTSEGTTSAHFLSCVFSI